MNVSFRLVRALALMWVAAMQCSAATLTWVGGDGDWSFAFNWDGGRVPGVNDVAVINSGIVTADWDSTIAGLTITGGRLQGVGTLRVTGAFTWTAGSMGSSLGFGEIIVEASGTATLAGTADKELGRRVENHGALTWSAGQLLFNNGTLVNAGVMTIAHDAKMTAIDGAAVFENSGTLYKSSAGGVALNGVSFNHTGTLNAIGTIKASSGLLESHGTVSPGLPVGISYIASDFSQGPEGTLRIELARFDSFDKLNVLGTATLRGALKVEVASGYAPTEGTQFDVIIFRSHIGNFDSIEIPALGGDLFLEPTWSNTKLVLTVKQKPKPTFVNSGIQSGDGAATFSISNIANRTFILEARDGFDAGSVWTGVLTNSVPSAVYDFIDAERASHAARFFRVRLVEQ